MTAASICLLLLYEKATQHVKIRLYGCTGEFGSELFSVSSWSDVILFKFNVFGSAHQGRMQRE